MADEQKDTVQQDPVTTTSILWPTLIATVLLAASMVWAYWDETYTRRPWKEYQEQWLEIAPEAYGRQIPAAEVAFARVQGSEEYQALQARYAELRQEITPLLQDVMARLNDEVLPRLDVIKEPVKLGRAKVTALVYEVQTSTGAARTRIANELAELKATRHSYVMPGGETVNWNYDELLAEFDALKTLQGELKGELARLNKPVADALKAIGAYRDLWLVGPDPQAIVKVRDSLNEFVEEIKQIHITFEGGEEIIDRCESCHLGVLSPVPITPKDLGANEAGEAWRRVFQSHTKKSLLAIHPPTQFGCTPCHNGNGIAVSSVETAHGEYKHWLWPMWEPENVYAGCIQCHGDDRVLPEGGVFNTGKQLFTWRGCWACHPYEGFDRENRQLSIVKKDLAALEAQLLEEAVELDRLTAAIDDPDTPIEELEALFAARSGQEQSLYLLDKSIKESIWGVAQMTLEVKKQGPNLKEVRKKLHPQWILPWLLDPLGFRPDTKMPQFRLDDEHAKDIAAYLWQNSNPDPVPEVEEGDAENGAWLFNVRGCRGCHKAFDEDEYETLGDGFASTLSREGEKANRDYLYAWIKDPRAHNVYTVMPSLRLSDDDARDIASWLASLVGDPFEEAPPPEERYGTVEEALAYLEDPARVARGDKLIRFLGCSGCHEIAGMELEGRIGTELTKEGSKPLERLDFGLLTHEAEREGWYDHKGFFEHKLENPATYDQGRVDQTFYDKLRMPDFHLEPGQVDALTTFLMGSVDSTLPSALEYRPEGDAKAIQEGWWIIKKYNCDGCHQVTPGEQPSLWNLPWYQDGAGYEGVPDKNGRPPTLVGEGSRVNPEWLSHFLWNPSLTEDPAEMDRNGVRQGLMVRMPTYFLSAQERGTLARFFEALSHQSPDYVRPDWPALQGDVLDTARAVFVAGDCSNCHLLGGEVEINPETTYAPSFEPVARRIKPEWTPRWVTRPNTVIPGTAMPALLAPEVAEDHVRWILDVAKISGAARDRLTERELQLISDYSGDVSELLAHYFAMWDEQEAAFVRAKREQ